MEFAMLFGCSNRRSVRDDSPGFLRASVRHTEAVSGESCGRIGCLAQSHRNGHVCDTAQ